MSILKDIFLKQAGNLFIITGIDGQLLVANLEPITAYFIYPFYFEYTQTSKQPIKYIKWK